MRISLIDILSPLCFLIILVSCNKKEVKKRIEIPENFTTDNNPYLNYENIKINKMRGKYVVYGGNKYTDIYGGVISPTMIFSGQGIYFAKNLSLRNEFFIVTKTIKVYTPPLPYYSVFDPYNQYYVNMVPGDNVTFVWNVGQGFDNWHSRFLANGWVDPLFEGDTITIMRIVQNTGEEDFNYSEAKTNVIIVKFDAATNKTTEVVNKNQPTTNIKKGEKLGVSQDFIYKKSGIYKITYKINTGGSSQDTVSSSTETNDLKTAK